MIADNFTKISPLAKLCPNVAKNPPIALKKAPILFATIMIESYPFAT